METKWMSSAFLMALLSLNAVIQDHLVEGNVAPDNLEMSSKGNWQGPAKAQMQRLLSLDSFTASASNSKPWMHGNIKSPPNGKSSLRNIPISKFPQPLAQIPASSLRSSTISKWLYPVWNSVINSVKKTWGTVEKYNVRPRDRGTLVSFEQSNTYQRASKACLDKNIQLGTWEAFKCSWIIDFGFAGLIESQGALDLGICTVSGILLEDNLWCLMWIVIRLLWPGVLPDILDSRRFYALMRQGLE